MSKNQQKVGAEHSRQKDQQNFPDSVYGGREGGALVKKQLPALSQSIPQHLSFQTQHTLGLDKRMHQMSLLNLRRMFVGPSENMETHVDFYFRLSPIMSSPYSPSRSLTKILS